MLQEADDFEKFGVYSKYINTESDKSKTGISTQRVTFFFIKVVIVGWDILAVKNSFDLWIKITHIKLDDLPCINQFLIISFCIISVVLINIIIYLITDGMKSDLSKMKPWGRK